MKLANFSLDYVASGSAANSSPNKFNLPESALNEAVVLFGQPILRALQQAEKKQMRLNDLIDKIRQDNDVQSFEQFQGVIRNLVALGLVRVAQNDPHGNNLIELIKAN